uniref:uncharacterized protein LOC122603397 n=1 Tax=Erigeron canadensis TaxID=72917 RepID=UPI001CB8E55A|nr:uncharacterized protein LOC122603397 [Erigeron canadensis]
MGQFSSKRVTNNLKNSTEFTTACKTVYQQSITLAQQTFQGIPLYQIPSASNNLYTILTNDTTHIPLINKWVTAPPTHSQIHKSLQKIHHDDDSIVIVGEEEFEEFAVSLFADIIVGNVEKDVLVKVVPVGVVGFGMVGRVGMNVVGTVFGVYALGVVTNVYLTLGG